MEIIDVFYESMKPVGSRPSILYGLDKIHQETYNRLPLLHSILLAIGTPTHKLAKFLPQN